jgi:hypothetical protein
LLTAALNGVALAQESPASEPAGPGAYITLDLEAGFPLDPFIVSVNGGGPVAAASLAEGCPGYVAEQPVLTANWTGEAEFIEIFTYSDEDPTLLVQLPDGTYLCSDDATDTLLDTAVHIDTPAAGAYKVWVGAYEADQLLPLFLVLTTRDEISLSTFDMGGLVERAPQPEQAGSPLAESPEAQALLDVVTTAEEASPALRATSTETETEAAGDDAADESDLEEFPLVVDAILEGASAVFTKSVTVSGELPAFLLNDGERTHCAGIIEEQPSALFELTEELPVLRIFAEAAADSTLVIVNEHGDIFCADDGAIDGEGLLTAHPMIDIANAPAGVYALFVGRFGDEAPLDAVITLDPTAEALPALLALPAMEEADE